MLRLASLVPVALAGCVVSTSTRVQPPLPPGNDAMARAARADALLGELAAEGRKNRLTGAAVVGIQGVLYTTIGGVAIAKRDEADEPRQTAILGGVSLGIGIACTMLGIWQLAGRSDEEEVHEDFRARAVVDSVTAVGAAERDLAALADKRHGQRVVLRTIGVLVLAGSVGGIVYGSQIDSKVTIGVGIFGAIIGGVLALGSLGELPAEETWSKWRVELGATATASGERVPVLGFGGRF